MNEEALTLRHLRGLVKLLDEMGTSEDEPLPMGVLYLPTEPPTTQDIAFARARIEERHLT